VIPRVYSDNRRHDWFKRIVGKRGLNSIARYKELDDKNFAEYYGSIINVGVDKKHLIKK